MPLRPLAIGIALGALALSLWLLIAAVRRHRWTSLLQVVPALCLLVLVAVLVPYIFGLNAPHLFFNRPAAVPAGTVVYYQYGPTATSNRVTLFAVDGQTGKLLWQYAMPGSDTYLTSADGIAYTVSLTVQPDQPRATQVYAFDGATGAIHWHVGLPGMIVWSAPVLAEGILYLVGVVVGSPSVQQLVALRPSNGAQLWSVRLGSTVADAPHLFAALGVLYVRTSVSTLQARRMTDGSLLWTTDHIQSADRIVAGPNAVYDLASYGSVIAYSAQTGAQLWQYGNNDFFHAGVSADDTLYVTAQRGGPIGDASGHLINPETLYALDAATGRPRWTFATQSYDSGQLAVRLDTVYIDAGDGIHALRASDGTLLWHSDPHTNRGFSTTFPVVGSSLYVTAVQVLPPETLNFSFFAPEYGQTYLYAVNAADGSDNWGVPVGPVFRIYGRGL